MGYRGDQASQIVVPGHQLLPLPADWSWSQGAACLVQGLTAAYALLEQGGLRPGHTVLVSPESGQVLVISYCIVQSYLAS